MITDFRLEEVRRSIRRSSNAFAVFTTRAPIGLGGAVQAKSELFRSCLRELQVVQGGRNRGSALPAENCKVGRVVTRDVYIFYHEREQFPRQRCIVSPLVGKPGECA